MLWLGAAGCCSVSLEAVLCRTGPAFSTFLYTQVLRGTGLPHYTGGTSVNKVTYLGT